MASAALIAQVNTFIEEYCGQKFTTTVVTEKVDGGGDILVLKYNNIASVTSVTDRSDSSVVTATAYETELDLGIINIKKWGSTTEVLHTFAKGVQRYEVVYTTGYSDQPSSVVLAASMITARMDERDDQSLMQENIGDYSYVKQLLMDGMTPEEKQLLKPYRNKRSGGF